MGITCIKVILFRPIVTHELF